ncbi:MAG: response regulator [Thermodesulfobacteriota bacterium]
MNRQARTTSTELDQRRRATRTTRLGRRFTRWLRERVSRRPVHALAERRGVLVIDDDRDFREALALLLGADGIAVAEAATGREALSLLPHGAPRLIVLDLDDAVADGIGFLATKRLLWRRDLRAVPVLALTSLETRARLAEELGASVVLRKPLRFDVLLDRVDLELA